MAYCLPPNLVKLMKGLARSGELHPEKLNRLDSKARREFLAKHLGEEHAKEVNLLFEKKLLLKNQEKGMYDWAMEITGLSKEAKDRTLQKIRDTYAEKKRRTFSPKEDEVFLSEIVADVYSKKFKTEVSLEEAQTIAELSSKVDKSAEPMREDKTFPSEKERLSHGADLVAFEKYIGALKYEADPKSLINPFIQKGSLKLSAMAENARVAANFIADNSRALLATFDNSFWGRQGAKVGKDPRFTKLWGRNVLKSFGHIKKTLGGGVKAGEAAFDAVRADVLSRSDALNGRYRKGGINKLQLSGSEEEIPTSAPSKIPVFGRVFKAAEVAYEAGAMKLRAEVASKFYEMAEGQGIKLTDEVVGGINRTVNIMTGRSSLGRFERAAPALNRFLFSVKFAKSNVDYLISPLKLLADPKDFGKQQAALNLLYTVAVMASYMGIRAAIDPDDVEFDPRSAAFGKIKHKDTYTDITEGAAAYVTLAARWITGETKSSVTGKITELGTYGQDDVTDLLWRFAKNKTSPLARQIMEVVDRKTYAGGTPDIVSVARGLTVPIVLQEGYESSQNEQSANALWIMIKDGMGISTNTYSINSNWQTRDSKEMTAFKKKVGEKRFAKANEDFNIKLQQWFAKHKNTQKYKAMKTEDKDKFIKAQKQELKELTFRRYNFFDFN